MNPIIVWLGIFILLLITEAATMGLTTIWFAGGALVALITALFGLTFGLQVICFFVISFVLLFFTRPLALSHFNKDREKTNLDSIVGAEAIVQKEINNLKGEGQVVLNGQEWMARTKQQQILAVGEIVRVKEIQGVKLIVEKSEQSDTECL